MNGYIHINTDDRRQLTPDQERTIEEAGCCIGSMMYGAHRCTCWETIYDIAEQAPPCPAQPGQRTEMCADCAYRPDSPERNGNPNQAGSEPGELDYIATTSTFWCHQGIRQPIGYRHPTLGIETTVPGISYEPPVIDAVPYKADGTPADRCAGWAARRRQLGADR